MEQFGRYLLLEKIAKGGMAEVFRAASVGSAGFAKLVAIKRILPHLADDASFVSMLIDEAKIAATLNHPNILQVLDLGDNQGQHFIAMEFVVGRSLDMVLGAALKNGRRLPHEFACHVIAQALHGLSYAHTKTDAFGAACGIIHRDISPQNIMVGYDGSVKLADFGIARAADRSTHTQTGAIKGKPGYMSPEQVLAKPIDQRLDLYAMGVVLHEMLTMRRMRKAQSDVHVLMAVANGEYPKFEDAGVSVHDELARIVYRALEPEPKNRWPDAHSFAVALEETARHRSWHCGGTQVSALMRELFPEEIERERQAQAYFANALKDFTGQPQAPQFPSEVSIILDDPADASTRVGGGAAKAAPADPNLFAPRPVPVPTPAPALVASAGSPPAVPSAIFVPPAGPGAGFVPPVPSGVFMPPGATPHPGVPVISFGTPPPPMRIPTPGPMASLADLDPQEVMHLTPANMKRPPKKSSSPIGAILGVLVVLVVAGGGGLWWMEQRKAAAPAASDVSPLIVETQPAGARVIAAGELQPGVTPLVVRDLPAGPVEVELSLDGMETIKRVVTMAAGAPQTLRVELAATARSVEIVSRPPGAAVLVNGVQTGTTPSRIPLKPGETASLRLTLAGHKPVERRIAGDQKSGRIEFKLEPESSAQPAPASSGRRAPSPPPVAAKPEPKPAPVVEKPAPASAPVDNTPGKLTIVSRPWASIILDGKDTGRFTPVMNMEVAPGKHTIKLVNSEHGLSATATVEVAPGQAVNVSKELKE